MYFYIYIYVVYRRIHSGLLQKEARRTLRRQLKFMNETKFWT